MTNHTYSWKGEVRLQRKGGGIGDKLAQAAARLFMIWWDRSFLILLESAGLTITMYKRYVDDGNVKMVALDPGAVWDSSFGRITYVDPELDDRQADRRTAEVVKSLADSVSSM